MATLICMQGSVLAVAGEAGTAHERPTSALGRAISVMPIMGATPDKVGQQEIQERRYNHEA